LESCEKKLDVLDNKISDVLISLNELKIAPSPQTDLKSQFADFYELETKKRNAVVFGIPTESVDDLNLLRNLVENSPIKPSDILYTFKDGPDRDSNGKPISQFNKVVFSTSKARNHFLSWIKTNKPRDLLIRARPDLTYAQREANRKLRLELNRRTNDGEQNLRIDYKNGKIVNLIQVTKYSTRSSVSRFPPK
jgi:hypothetical protein